MGGTSPTAYGLRAFSPRGCAIIITLSRLCQRIAARLRRSSADPRKAGFARHTQKKVGVAPARRPEHRPAPTSERCGQWLGYRFSQSGFAELFLSFRGIEAGASKKLRIDRFSHIF